MLIQVKSIGPDAGDSVANGETGNAKTRRESIAFNGYDVVRNCNLVKEFATIKCAAFDAGNVGAN